MLASSSTGKPSRRLMISSEYRCVNSTTSSAVPRAANWSISSLMTGSITGSRYSWTRVRRSGADTTLRLARCSVPDMLSTVLPNGFCGHRIDRCGGKCRFVAESRSDQFVGQQQDCADPGKRNDRVRPALTEPGEHGVE